MWPIRDLLTFQPDRSWEIDIEHMESLVDDDTAAIVVNNPSNPCGSVFSKEHIRDILAFADRHKVPIIADEIYAHFVSTSFDPSALIHLHFPYFLCLEHCIPSLRSSPDTSTFPWHLRQRMFLFCPLVDSPKGLSDCLTSIFHSIYGSSIDFDCELSPWQVPGAWLAHGLGDYSWSPWGLWKGGKSLDVLLYHNYPPLSPYSSNIFTLPCRSGLDWFLSLREFLVQTHWFKELWTSFWRGLPKNSLIPLWKLSRYEHFLLVVCFSSIKFFLPISQRNAEIAYEVMSKTPGLKPCMPAGAMYMMVSTLRFGTKPSILLHICRMFADWHWYRQVPWLCLWHGVHIPNGLGAVSLLSSGSGNSKSHKSIS